MKQHICIKRKNGTKNAIKAILYQNAHPTIKCITEREVAITLCFQLCFAYYTMLQTKNNTRSVSAVNPIATENTGNKHNSQHSHRETASRCCELTLCIVSKKNFNTNGGKGKSMMYVLHVLWLVKRHISG